MTLKRFWVWVVTFAYLSKGSLEGKSQTAMSVTVLQFVTCHTYLKTINV